MSSTSSPSSQSGNQHQPQEIKVLLSEIKTLAEAKDFVGAEKVRDTLIEIAPMALQEIIESAEIIEKEKSGGIDAEHLALWDDLYKDLSEEEKNCIFYSLGKIVVPAKKKILSKGKSNDRLFFIEDGKVAVYKTKGDKNILVAQLGRGNLLGEYTFTTISLCSASALTQSDVTMYHLKSSATDDWDEKHPGLLQKLTKFCDKKGNLDEIARRRKMEKWKYARHKIKGMVTANLLTKEGQKTESFFHGDLIDISRDGASFGVEIQNKKTARALLTEHLDLSFTCNLGDEEISFSAVGKVVRVSFQLYSSYIVHIYFDTLIEENVIEKITGKEE
jgi:CRP-like cAMP-binding protein